MIYTHNGVSGNYLDRIDALVLLDLLGAQNPTIFSMNPRTEVTQQFELYEMSINVCATT
jgi:hypothetical protein